MTIDGAAPIGFPMTFEQTVDEAMQLLPVEKASDGNDTSFTAATIGDVDAVNFLFLRAVDRALGIRVEGGEATNVAIRLDAGGFILIGKATALTDTNITVNNNSGAVAKLSGIAGGT